MASQLKIISVLMAGAILLFAVLVIGGAVLVVVMSANRQLPNGYRVFCTNPENCSISNSDGKQIVPPHVVEWSTQSGGLVMGKLSSGETFELDTNTGKVSRSGTSRDDAKKIR